MKKLILPFFALLFTFSFAACGDDDDDKDYYYPYVDRNLLNGKWGYAGLVDSTVLVFENDMMKEYLFDRTSKQPLDFINYGKYYLNRKAYYDGRKDENTITIEYYNDYNKDFFYYNLEGNILRITGNQYSRTEFIRLQD